MAEEAQSTQREPSRLLVWLRPVVGTALLAMLLYVVPLREVAGHIGAARTRPLLLAFVLAFAAMAVSALKLWLLVRTDTPGVSFTAVLRAYYVGAFFNNFLPTSIGGDVMKIGELHSRSVATGHAAAAVVVERGTGVLVVMAMAAVVGLGRPDLFRQIDLLPARWPMAALGIGFFATAAAAYGLWRAQLKDFLKERRDRRVPGALYRVISAFYVFRNRLGVLIAAVGLSVVFYALVAANIHVVARAVAFDLRSVDAASILPCVKVPEMLPVAPGALGVREGALAWCLAGVGAVPARAAAIALLLRAITWLHSALGGAAYVLARRRTRMGQEE